MLNTQKNTFLEYIPGKSILYKANPGFKFFLLIAICILLGLNNGYYSLTGISIIIFFLILSEKNVKLQIISMWKVYIFFIIMGVVKYLTSDSVESGFFFCFRLIFMTIAGSLFYSTTKLSELRLILSRLFSKKIANLFIMMLAFLPIIFLSLRQQEEARYCRNFKIRKNFFRSIKMISLPLLIDMFLKTEEMADSWYSRGYRDKQ